MWKHASVAGLARLPSSPAPWSAGTGRSEARSPSFNRTSSLVRAGSCGGLQAGRACAARSLRLGRAAPPALWLRRRARLCSPAAAAALAARQRPGRSPGPAGGAAAALLAHGVRCRASGPASGAGPTTSGRDGDPAWRRACRPSRRLPARSAAPLRPCPALRSRLPLAAGAAAPGRRCRPSSNPLLLASWRPCRACLLLLALGRRLLGRAGWAVPPAAAFAERRRRGLRDALPEPADRLGRVSRRRSPGPCAAAALRPPCRPDRVRRTACRPAPACPSR